MLRQANRLGGSRIKEELIDIGPRVDERIGRFDDALQSGSDPVQRHRFFDEALEMNKQLPTDSRRSNNERLSQILFQSLN